MRLIFEPHLKFNLSFQVVKREIYAVTFTDVFALCVFEADDNGIVT